MIERYSREEVKKMCEIFDSDREYCHQLTYQEYLNKLRGCFTGKAVGGTLGMSWEGLIAEKKVTYYDPVPTTMIANDDLDLQIIWLEVLYS